MANAKPLKRLMESDHRFERAPILVVNSRPAIRPRGASIATSTGFTGREYECPAANGLLREGKRNCDHPETSAHITGVHAEITAAQNCAEAAACATQKVGNRFSLEQ
jgi:hypothetical protein